MHGAFTSNVIEDSRIEGRLEDILLWVDFSRVLSRYTLRTFASLPVECRTIVTMEMARNEDASEGIAQPWVQIPIAGSTVQAGIMDSICCCMREPPSNLLTTTSIVAACICSERVEICNLLYLDSRGANLTIKPSCSLDLPAGETHSYSMGDDSMEIK